MTEIIHQAAACYYPTTVLLVDDAQIYLENIESGLKIDAGIYKPFNNPVELLDYYEANQKRKNLTELCVQTKIENNHIEANIDLKPILEEVYNPKRFEYITAIVADHDMPTMKGLDLFKKLKNAPVKKILLTGVAGTQQALDAYNEHIIDKYIHKSEKDGVARIDDALKVLCLEQFKNNTRMIVNNLTRLGNTHCCLNSTLFLELFENIVKEHHICEYYLIDKTGSYVLYDLRANPSWLIVKNQDDINADIKRAESVDAPAEIIQQLKEHKLILVCLSEQDKIASAKDWMAKGLLHPAQKFTSHGEDFYYVHIDKDTSLNTIDKSKILSFHQYLKQLPG